MDKNHNGKDVVGNILQKFDQYESFHQPYRERFLRYYQYFRCYISKGYFFEVSKLVPYAFSTIMSILPRLVVHKPRLQYVMNKIPDTVLRDNDLAGKINSVEEMSDKDRIIAINKIREKSSSLMNIISDYQWEKIGGDTRLSEFLTTSLIYGTCIAYYKWDDDLGSPIFETMLPFNFFPDPSCTHARDLKRCFRRVFKHYDDIKTMFEDGQYSIPIEYIGKEDKFFEDLKGKRKADKDKVDMAERQNTDLSYQDEEIEIIEYYENDRIVTIVGREFLVKDIKNDMGELPFIIGYNTYCPGEFWGIGEVEMIEQYVEDATDLRANRKENMIMTNNNQWIIDVSKQVYMEDFVAAPNQIIRAEGGSQTITPLQKQPISRESYMEEDIMRRDIIEVSGQAEYFRGTRPEGGVETATAISSLADAAQARWNLKLRTLTDYFLKPLGYKWIELNKKNLKPFEMRLDEKDRSKNYLTMTIDLDVIKSLKTEYEIRVEPGNHRTTSKDQINTLLQIVMQSEFFQQRIDMEKFFMKVFEIFDIPVFDVVKTDEQVAEEQERLRAQQEAEAMAQQTAAQENVRNTLMQQIQNNPQAMDRLMNNQGAINRRI